MKKELGIFSEDISQSADKLTLKDKLNLKIARMKEQTAIRKASEGKEVYEYLLESDMKGMSD